MRFVPWAAVRPYAQIIEANTRIAQGKDPNIMAKIFAAALLAGAAATAIALAPAASADRGDTRGPSQKDSSEVDRSPHKPFPPARVAQPDPTGIR